MIFFETSSNVIRNNIDTENIRFIFSVGVVSLTASSFFYSTHQENIVLDE